MKDDSENNQLQILESWREQHALIDIEGFFQQEWVYTGDDPKTPHAKGNIFSRQRETKTRAIVTICGASPGGRR